MALTSNSYSLVHLVHYVVTPNLMRKSVQIETSGKFLHPPNYARQYTGIYQDRLEKLRPRISPPEDWKDGEEKARTLDLPVGKLAYCTGCIVRKPHFKSNIFSDLKQMYHGVMPAEPQKYASAEDEVFLEDDGGRVPLKGLETEVLVTGTVAAVLGVLQEDGSFEVVSVCYPSTPANASTAQIEGKIAVLCGLNLKETVSEDLQYTLLLEHLLTTPYSALIIAGNSLAEDESKLVGSRVLRPKLDLTVFSRLDSFLFTLCKALPVFIMSGPTDPTSTAFPQLPIHSALFKSCRQLVVSKVLQSVSNPELFTINSEFEILCSSGQPVTDLKKYDFENKLSDIDLMEKTLNYGHLAPTAPDTLWSYPYVDDPMVITKKPDVYFSANSSEFTSKLRDDVLYISVPPFNPSGTLVVLDLATKEVETVNFK